VAVVLKALIQQTCQRTSRAPGPWGRRWALDFDQRIQALDECSTENAREVYFAGGTPVALAA